MDDDTSCQSACEIRLPEVSEWFVQRRLPYPEHLDSWLVENAFGTVERLKLVDDADWRMLLQRSEKSFTREEFDAFKTSIVALRQIPFDDLHDWTRDPLAALPLGVYGHIGRFLSIQKDIKWVRDRRGHPLKWVYVHSEVMALCIACGKAVADTVRFAYLNQNKEYLRKAICSETRRNKKITYWMKENDWKSLCGRRPVTSFANYTRVVLTKNAAVGDHPHFIIEKDSSGGYNYVEFEDVRGVTMVKKQFEGLLFIDSFRIKRTKAQGEPGGRAQRGAQPSPNGKQTPFDPSRVDTAADIFRRARAAKKKEDNEDGVETPS